MTAAKAPARKQAARTQKPTSRPLTQSVASGVERSRLKANSSPTIESFVRMQAKRCMVHLERAEAARKRGDKGGEQLQRQWAQQEAGAAWWALGVARG